MIECPYCKSLQNTVEDSRQRDDGRYYRRRLCIDCSKYFTTYEVYSPDGPPNANDFKRQDKVQDKILNKKLQEIRNEFRSGLENKPKAYIK